MDWDSVQRLWASNPMLHRIIRMPPGLGIVIPASLG